MLSIRTSLKMLLFGKEFRMVFFFFGGGGGGRGGGGWGNGGVERNTALFHFKIVFFINKLVMKLA